jgi:hypothetical protein
LICLNYVNELEDHKELGLTTGAIDGILNCGQLMVMQSLPSILMDLLDLDRHSLMQVTNFQHLMIVNDVCHESVSKNWGGVPYMDLLNGLSYILSKNPWIQAGMLLYQTVRVILEQTMFVLVVQVMEGK